MLSLNEKIKLIRELAKKHEITYYEIGENTDVSTKTAYNIFTSDENKPRVKTLNKILNYIEKKIEGSIDSLSLNNKYTTENRINSIARETETDYESFNNLKIDDKLNEIYRQIVQLKELYTN